MVISRLNKIHTQGIFFVTRAKLNMQLKRMYSSVVGKTSGVQFEQICKMETYYTKKDNPDKLPRIKYYDLEKKK